MSKQARMISYILSIIVLGALGVWQIVIGESAMGAALISSVLAVTVVRIIKNRRLEEQIARGLNPNDERAYYIAGKAASCTLSIWIAGTALFVLGGSTLGPELAVNPYNFAGIGMTLLILVYIAAYYYFNRHG